jgi:hypothetical protein
MSSNGSADPGAAAVDNVQFVLRGAMTTSFAVRVVTLFGLLAGASASHAQQVDCRFFRITADNLGIYTEPRGDSTFLGSLGKNDFVCVAGDQQVGDRKWAYVAYQLRGGDERKTLDGWGIMTALVPASQDEVAAVRNSRPRPVEAQGMTPPRDVAPPAAADLGRPPLGMEMRPPLGAEMRPPGEPPPPPPAAFAEPRPVPPSRPEEVVGDDEVRWSQPIKSGAYPVQGYSLEELVKGVPQFAPIEGLPEEVWRKPCGNCHQWNPQSLCVQAKIYASDPKMAFRKQHPYGGPEKVAMMKWAQQGCR